MNCAVLRLLAALLAAAAAVVAQAQYTTGRATFYGNEPWAWSIHHGSCSHGYQWPDEGTGWDIAALSDSMPNYAGSCGRCYEVKCASMSVKDGYGDSISRDGVCKDSEASVIVKTTDTCPCNYPNNYFSNKRWCCGDMDHFDVSVWAFQKLTDMKWGVIPIQYRELDCGRQPSKRAEGASFPGEFPSIADAKAKGKDEAWYRQYFPDGGYLNAHAGDGSSKISVEEFMQRLGQSATPATTSSTIPTAPPTDATPVPADSISSTPAAADAQPPPQFNVESWIWG